MCYDIAFDHLDCSIHYLTQLQSEWITFGQVNQASLIRINFVNYLLAATPNH